MLNMILSQTMFIFIASQISRGGCTPTLVTLMLASSDNLPLDQPQTTFTCYIYMTKRGITLCSNAHTGKENPEQLTTTEKKPR